MQCYSELLPPTAVTDAIALNFTQSSQRDLVVAKTSLLQLFRVHRSNVTDTTRLQLIGEYELSGTITSLRSIHTQDDRDGVDSLLIAFRHAKISLVKWDHDNHRISTTSIHYYENDPIPRQPCDTGASSVPSILTVDPSSRCVALKFDQRQLAILPFKQQGEELNELDDIEIEDKTLQKQSNGTTQETPYKKSFVLSLPSLDESLTDVMDLAFLHDYREPTFGVLTSRGQASSALWHEGKDILTYHIVTLDLEQGASTILASIPLLPANLWKVQPLPAPFGGALLVGTNEIIHVAQSGKTHAVIVNEFAQLTGGFTTSDQSSLDLKLEDCVIGILDANAGDLLVTLRDGCLAVLHFTLLGPDVKALSFTMVSPGAGGALLEGLPSCITTLDDATIFLGTDEADSLLLQCHKTSSGRKRSHAEMSGIEDVADGEAEEDDEVDDDDLYGSTTRRTRATTRNTRASQPKTMLTYSFEMLDKLTSLGPLSKPCLANTSANGPGKLELAAITGRGRGSKLTLMSRDLQPRLSERYSVDGAKAVWSTRAVKPKKKGQAIPPGDDNLLFVYDGTATRVYHAPWSRKSEEAIEEVLIEMTGTEFEHEGESIDINTLGSGRWVVHCRQAEVRTYEPDLSLSQIIPMADDDSEAELTIVHTSFCDPYLLIIRNDGSLQLLAFDTKSQDIEPLELPETILKQKFLSGALYRGSFTNDQVIATLLSDDGTFMVLSLPSGEVSYTALNLAHLPPILSSDAAQRRVGYKETLTEVLMADIGAHGHSQAFLIVRTASDDLILYEPFRSTQVSDEDWTAYLKFRKVPVPYLPRYDEYLDETSSEKIPSLQPLRIGSHDAVAIPGKPPSILISEPGSRPKVHRLQDVAMSSILSVNQHTGNANTAVFASLLEGELVRCIIPDDISIDIGWSVRKLDLGAADDELCHIAFHEESGMYVVSTCKQVDFLFSEEDTRHADQDDIASRPKVPQYSLHLFSAATHRIIDTYTFPPGEAVTCVEVMPIDTSEHTHVVRPLVAVGTALFRGEDMPARGALVLFELLSVIPEPGDPETGVKLHVLSREGVKGAVTTVAPFIGGLIGISQGQKIMVRGMKEDGSCLPVAFLDVLCQLSTLKTLWQTGLWLAGDSWKGLWFGGFTEDPYKLTFLGKSQTHMEVLCAEFLPFEGQLFILVIDADMDLHVLQYDPEDPKTVSGAKLLYKATFHLGQWPTSMTLVPSTLVPLDEQAASNGIDDDPEHQPLYHILITTQSGSINLITPVDSGAFRRLSNLHGQMTSILEQPAALNPRDYRASAGDATAARGIIDGMLIQRIGELGSARRAEVLGRCGSDAWTMRSDMEVISGGGLAWL